MTELISAAAEGYAAEHTTPFDGQLAEVAAWTREHTDVPQMMSGLAEARLLQALIVVGGARRVLEIGTFTGLGALAMAAALPGGGKLITLEIEPERAARAAEFFAQSPFGERIELIEGNALETLDGLDGPFDLVYIDAWKSDYPAYYEAVIGKLADRGVIVADNMFRSGGVLDPSSQDEGIRGLRQFAQLVQNDDRVVNVMLTVGDGLMLAWRR
ncbi:MAG TPA: class I SAM-dependent methyltransferase [Solirubrobacteraceae bacterium]|nr:class I SAM-dependent methyltransferase [Solirubrobacteraceae bacterium]